MKLWRRLSDLFTLFMIIFLVTVCVWTGYQAIVVFSGGTPSFADAGSYYWQVAER